ncbi:hypothetical protein B0O80DRAFT_258581 [Mortierella sp. GBAus27b]|nr:hypothetical protein B0O80DRAFT_258581 [Mortierella sp. GBAus27b]
MEVTQSFRLAGTTDTLEISCDQDDGQNVIYWTDILDAFPGVQYVKNGNLLVKRLKDFTPDENKPQRIKHYPGVVLDVVLSDSTASDPTTSATAYSKQPAICDQPSDPSRTATDPLVDDNVAENLQATESNIDRQTIKDAQRNALESTFEQRLVSFLPPEIQTQVLASSDVHGSIVQAIENGKVDPLQERLVACFQALKDEMVRNVELASRNNELESLNSGLVSEVKELTLKNNELVLENTDLTNQLDMLLDDFGTKQEEMKQLHKVAIDRLSLLQNRTQALIRQNYELREYPIPRLFIVLPQVDGSFSNKFRLHFLCECGEHTKSSNSKIPHHIHLAKHEGYEITQPTEFFQQYGPYVLTILAMLKFGISVTGVAVPAVSHLISTDALDQATENLKLLARDIQTGLNQAIGRLEKTTGDNGQAADEFSEQMRTNEALEGADLRKLETFLKNKDDHRSLGNLYRITTSEGCVKWVCVDHYRANYNEGSVQVFRDTVESLGGAFDENIGRVEINLRSRIPAEHFYQALENARSVYELDIALEWDTTQNDFKKLRDSLIKSNMVSLSINLHHREGPTSDILNRNQRYDPILDIMRHPSIRSITIIGARKDFIKRSRFASSTDYFTNLKHFGIGLSALQQDPSSIKILINRMHGLTSLAFEDYIDDCLIAWLYITFAEYQRFSITFACKSLCIPPLDDRSEQYLDKLLDLDSANINNLVLRGHTHEEAVTEAFAGLTRNSTGLKSLELGTTSRDFGSRFIRNVANIVSRSELIRLDVHLERGEGRVPILEPIQWRHLRDLSIHVSKDSVGAHAMKVLIKGKDNAEGSGAVVELEIFQFWCSSRETISGEQAELLRSFVASTSTSLKTLSLNTIMTPAQTLSVLNSNSIGMSQLEELQLQAKGYSSDQVDGILGCLRTASKLRQVTLSMYNPTQEQEDMMKARGVTLRG